MNKEIASAKGDNGSLILYDNKIKVVRTGFQSFLINFRLRGNKEIYLKNISSIQLKKAGFTSGYIRFEFMGCQFNTAYENTITFQKSQEKDFERIKELIEKKL